MTPETLLKFDLTVTLTFLLSVLAMVFAWWRTRDRNLDQRFEAVDQRFREGADRMTRHDARLNLMEAAMRELPTRSDLHQLQLGMSEMRGDMRALIAKLEGQSEIMTRVETIVSRHEEHLMERGK